MRFTYAEAMTDPSFYAPLAQAAEASGYHGMTIADSLAYPEVSDSTYPYNADGSREFLDDKPFIESFILIAALAAVTSTLRFVPFVIKLPVRPPALVAKQAGSIAWMSGNRLALGVGLSPWPGDLRLMGVPCGKRGQSRHERTATARGRRRVRRPAAGPRLLGCGPAPGHCRRPAGRVRRRRGCRS